MRIDGDVLLDFVEIVVHIQRTEEREFYDLERLWKDCPLIEFTDRDAAGRAAVAVGSGSGAGGPASGSRDEANPPAGSW